MSRARYEGQERIDHVMKCFIGETEFHILEPTVVAIGKFDGRHTGHQKILRRMLQLRDERGWRTAVFTFGPAAGGQVPSIPRKVITTGAERRAGMESMGIDYLVEYPFTEQVSHMPAEDFLREILIAKMNAKAVVAGTDCGFGYKRSGDAKLLLRLAGELGYEAEIIDKVRDDDRDVSSSYVKEELDKGHIEKVNELLGHPYSFCGTVVRGDQIGGPKLGHPTANIVPPPEKYLPPYGVYVSRVLLDGKWYGGVTDIGEKPTFGGRPAAVETNLLDWSGDLYGRDIQVQLLHFERPEQKFGSLGELKEQLGRDEEYARSYLDKHSSLC